MKFYIRGEWSVEVKNSKEAQAILDYIENAAGQKNCELENSEIEAENEDEGR